MYCENTQAQKYVMLKKYITKINIVTCWDFYYEWWIIIIIYYIEYINIQFNILNNFYGVEAIKKKKCIL